MLATINWANEAYTGFLSFDEFGADEPIARALVNRAIDDWERVIVDFDYDGDGNSTTNNTFDLDVFAVPFPGTGRGQTTNPVFDANGIPTFAEIGIDLDGGGKGWYFDPTPLDDAEFTGITNTFEASFVDAIGEHNDFYRTILHEIGHALGITSVPAAAISQYLNQINPPQSEEEQLLLFNNPDSNAQFGIEAGFVVEGGLHSFEGPVSPSLPNFPIHPNNLMNRGETVPPPGANPVPTVRQFIPDTMVKVLADAYGYEVELPSTLNAAYASLDSQTGTLLVQGLPGAVNESIDVAIVGNEILVTVENTTESFPLDRVTKIVVAGNGGNDTITIDTALSSITSLVDYVVSSNEDAVDTGMLGDGLVDLDSNAPGNQVSLRAAIQDSNSSTTAKLIYIPRGDYLLAPGGSGGDFEGDLDITGDVTVIGAGAGATVIDIDPAQMARHFKVTPGSSLEVARMTLTGGTQFGGSSILVASDPSSTGVALTLTETALVNNGFQSNGTPVAFGGGIYVGDGAQVQINKSVITNDASSFGAGGIFAEGGSGGGARVTLSESIVANNTAGIGAQPDLNTGGTGADRGEFISQGHNLIGKVGVANFTLDPTDYESPTGSVDYVVTSVVDTFEHLDDDSLLSLREAIDLTNDLIDTPEEIWIPAWRFSLTRRSSTPGAFDNDIAFGDLEITDSLTLRGAGGNMVQVVQEVVEYQDFDAAFDLLGDFTGNGTTGDDGDVDGMDYLAWLFQTGSSNGDYSADADDDGDVDSDDLGYWIANSGNLLSLINIG